ncbi:hypothetical protein CIHG_03838 [Coccidioides immitis H538.4]|uniref:Secreted protein n=2 Tax=Coccidioides immitis TaxID=5501 RepID=A0A0J8RMJ2_COCIT|nr:hypothetical protein CIRG_03590 [Coccidioides immitis RMSCC 2394]KMU86052.1 hypothetical protein CIHG_03838 [Coccidioides immitis H538.4]
MFSSLLWFLTLHGCIPQAFSIFPYRPLSSFHHTLRMSKPTPFQLNLSTPQESILTPRQQLARDLLSTTISTGLWRKFRKSSHAGHMKESVQNADNARVQESCIFRHLTSTPEGNLESRAGKTCLAKH